MKAIRWIKSLWGAYESGYEYMVRFEDIKITPEFRKTWIYNDKWERKNTYYRKLKQFESRIVLKRDFTLVDGYSSYKIAKINGLKKVPVWFVD